MKSGKFGIETASGTGIIFNVVTICFSICTDLVPAETPP